MRLEQPSRGDYQALIALWEASVRATHHFLPDEEIATLRELILEHYFDAVTSLAPATTRIAGFCGVHEGNIEMLFIDPALRGGGVGRLLVADAIARLGRPGWTSTSRMSRRSAFIATWASRWWGARHWTGRANPIHCCI